MTIAFNQDLTALVTLLRLGGYQIRGTRHIPGECGRSADLHLSNGVIVCWDSHSCKIWIDRFSRRGQIVEKYLVKMCQGARLFRLYAIYQTRLNSEVEHLHTAIAEWLLHSEGLLARILRQQIGRA
ncbi:MAG: hypothetical protein QM760_11000 [Nibricoccus sp.]